MWIIFIQMRKTSNYELIFTLGFGAMRLAQIDKIKAIEMIYYAYFSWIQFCRYDK
jgi:hypothetical protein